MNSPEAGALNVNRGLTLTGLGLCSVLLIKFAIDFRAEGLVLAVPFSALVIVSLTLAVVNVVAASRTDRSTADSPATTGAQVRRALALAIIPFSYFAASLGCSGLTLSGCTPFCTFVKLVWIPVIALACAAYYFFRNGWLSAGITLACFVPMLPHCRCYNVANAWWIDRIGASPECYVWPFLVSIIMMASIRAGKNQAISLLVCGLIAGGAFTFFVSHHYFHFPW